jgi:GTP cyclohydrolase I
VCEKNLGVAVMIEASHMCTCVRGVKHEGVMKTAKLSGNFFDWEAARDEFYDFIRDLK